MDRGLLSEPFWTCGGNAEQLPVSDETMDVYVTAFCMRNVTHLPTALQEAKRVLKPGGHFLCLEFSTVALPLLSEIYDLYSFQVLPILGQMVAGDRDSYQYLAESIRRFPEPSRFCLNDHGRRLGAGASPECQRRHCSHSFGLAAVSIRHVHLSQEHLSLAPDCPHPGPT